MRIPWERGLATGATLLLVVSLLLFAAAFLGGAGDTGWQDLARIAGALVLLVGAGLGFGLALLAGRRGGGRVPRWRLVLEAGGALAGLAAALFLASVAVQSWSMPLLLVLFTVVAVTLAGLATVPARWRAT